MDIETKRGGEEINTRETVIIISPEGAEEECAKFSVDTMEECFVLEDVLKSGEFYTFSIYVKSEEENTLSIEGVDVTVGTEWERVSVTFLASDADLTINFAPGVFYFYKAQLESGTIATDPAPSPEDMESSIKEIRAELKIASDSIELMVKEEDLTGNYIVGKINLDSTSALISAKNIDLKGYVTITDLKESGKTVINGANIQSETITADKIDITDLFAQNISATNLHITDKSTLGGWNIEGANIVSDNGGDSETEEGYGRAILTDGRVEFSSNYTKSADGSSCGVKSAWWLDGKGLGGSEYRESVGETRTALVELEGITLEQYESATTLWASYKVDGLEFVDSLMGEIQEKTTISKSGIELYRADGATYGGNLSIGINGFTYTNDGDNTLNFKGATNYLFDSTLRTTKGMTFGTNAYTTEYGIGTVWKDGKNHNVVSRYSDGLLVSFGWVGGSDYATISRVRGRTVQYQNSSGTTTLSDERLKEDFRTLENWEKFFDALEPCAFKLKTGTSGRYHIGFKAQQVEEALLGSGLTTGDFAGLVKMQYTPDTDDEEGNAVYKSAGIEVGDELYGVIYTELIGLAIGEIQKLKKRVKKLEEKL